VICEDDPQGKLTSLLSAVLLRAGKTISFSVEAGSRAEEFGFRKGDLITSVERQAVTSLVDLRKILNHSASKTKKVRVVPGIETVKFKLTSSSI